MQPASDVGAPAEVGATPSAERSTAIWKFAAFCTFFPATAVLHHRVFVKPHCMTNLLSTPKIALEWVTSDPSPWLGLLVGIVAVILVSRIPRLRFWAAAIPIVSFPLCVWLWDIPGSTYVCPHFHDGKIGVRSWHLYLLAMILYLPAVKFLQRRSEVSRQSPTSPLSRVNLGASATRQRPESSG